jgi:RNA polymerase sigma-70 factor (ECF subfamily)
MSPGTRPIEELLARRSAFLSFVERRVGSRELAEEILQDAFARSVEAAADVRNGESIVAWFYRVLRNAVIDAQRKEAARKRANAALAKEAVALEEPVPSPDVRNAICRCVSTVVETLKPEYADAIRLVDLDDAPLARLAEASGITSGNAAVRLHRARQALAREVRRTCGACAEHGCVDCTCRHL